MPGPALLERPPARRPHALNAKLAIAGCLVLSALTLLLLNEPDYDPTAWLIWGRELSHGTLSTLGGPSWKPLPVAFTTLFAFAGDGASPLLWLVVARTGGLAAIVLAFVVARRLGGPRAGALAAVALVLATDFVYNFTRGDSEGLLVAAALGAVELHLSGRRRLAFAAGLAAALLRPEVWLLLAAYGVWLVRRERAPATIALVALSALGLLAAWFLPDLLAAGDALRSASRAQNPVPGSPGQSAFPLGLTFVLALVAVTWPVYAGTVYAVVQARRAPVRGPRERLVLALAGVALALTTIVGLLAEAGFTGNIRYVALPAALLCVVGAVGLSELVPVVRRRAGRGALRAVVALAAIGVAVSVGIMVGKGVRLARDEQIAGPQLDALLARAGGPEAVRACGQVHATPFQRQMLAWQLDLPSRDVLTHGTPQGTYFIRDGANAPGAELLPVRAQVGRWTLRSSCPLG